MPGQVNRLVYDEMEQCIFCPRCKSTDLEAGGSRILSEDFHCNSCGLDFVTKQVAEWADGGVFYSLCEDDILEVANAQDIKLTSDEMARVKAGVEKGLGNCWWDIVESAIDDVVSERR